MTDESQLRQMRAFEPKEDITALELARIFEIIHFRINAEYELPEELERHFAERP